MKILFGKYKIIIRKLTIIVLTTYLVSCRGYTVVTLHPVLSPSVFQNAGEELQFINVFLSNSNPKDSNNIDERSLLNDYIYNRTKNEVIINVQGRFEPIHREYDFKIVKVKLSNGLNSIIADKAEKKVFRNLWLFEDIPENINRYYIHEYKFASFDNYIMQETRDKDLGSYYIEFLFNEEILVNDELCIEIFFKEGNSNVQSIIFKTRSIYERRIHNYYNDFLEAITTQ